MPGGVPSDIYLDANATTRVLPQAADEAKAAMEELFGNPSSSHITGIRARHILETTRSLVRSVLGAESGQIIFTSGATEAIQMGIFSTLVRVREQREPAADQRRLLLYGATEHKAVPQALTHWNQTLGLGNDVLEIPVDRTGALDLEFVREHAISADMICTMAVNNETGVIHDLQGIEQVLGCCGVHVPWMVDCVQAIGKTPLNMAATTIDYAPISGHKLHAPKGIGLLYVRENAPLTPLFAGGGQESGARSGTENLPGVAALAAVFHCLNNENDSTFKDSQTLMRYRDRVVASLERALPSIVFNTPFDTSVPTTINFSVHGVSSKEIMDLFDAAGIRVSSGSACGSALRGSFVLDAMSLPRWRSEGAIRISFGLTTTESEIAAACTRIEEAGKALCDSGLVVSEVPRTSAISPVGGLLQLKHGTMCSWILMDSKTRHCVVIDPCEELCGRIENLICSHNCHVLAVLDTHCHVDHESCREKLLKRLGDHVTESAYVGDILGWPNVADGTAVLGDDTRASYIRFTSDEVLARTDLSGHTTDSQIYLVGQLSKDDRLEPQNVRFAFSGDTLLIGGVGRTDFQSSSIADLYNSLRKMPRIVTKNTLICPSHDYTDGFSTTLASEQRSNKLLARVLDASSPMSFDEFKETKNDLDSSIDDENNDELFCGLIHVNTNQGSSIDISPEQWKQFFEEHHDSRIIDVREAHEFKFVQDWGALGLRKPPENVPLTRFSNFMQRLLIESSPKMAPQDLIFICRSGNRSGKAADTLRRVGVKNAWHISGGIALGGRPNGVSADSIDIDYVI